LTTVVLFAAAFTKLWHGVGSRGLQLAGAAARLVARKFPDCERLTSELQRGPLSKIQNNVLVNPDWLLPIATANRMP
jgi:hypothetical protein